MRTRIALVCTVWGPEFTDFFCQYSLATLLSPTNLPRASATYDFTLLLYTLEDDLARMRGHRNFRKLATLVNIRTVLIETLPSGARRGHWIQWHHALLSSNEFSSFILLIPDCLYANDAIEKIAQSLETNDIVYYCIPQICIEPVLSYLDGASHVSEGENPYSFLDFHRLDIASIFVKYINPRYAVALDRPEFFVTHPEYVLHAAKDNLQIHEITCHSLAVSNRARAVSYTLNPSSKSVTIGFLELLAVGVERTLKYLEQYYRWPSHGMMRTRHATLAGWYYSFFESRATDYSNTKTDITVSGLQALAQQRTSVTSSRVKYARNSQEYYAAFYAIYSGPANNCQPEVRRAMALAICLPGFRKAVMSIGRPFTIILPVCEQAIPILDILYGLGDPRQTFRFLLMHVVQGRLMLKVGQTFVFERTAGEPSYRPRLRVIEPELARYLSNSITGEIQAQPTYVTDDVIAYIAKVQYGSPHDFVQNYMKRPPD
jgi:hypothetical protein